MKGRLIATPPTITAPSVYMIVSGWRTSPRAPARELTAPFVPKTTIHPAARTALPTKSGRTTSISRRFLWRLSVRASQ